MRILERIYRWNGTIAGFLTFGLAVLITADVLKRWITGKPFIGIFELAQVAFLALTFLALGLTEHTRRQMRVDMLISRVKGRASYFLATINSLLAFGFWGLILWLGCKDWLLAFRIHDVRQGMIEIPSVIHLGFLVYGSLSICLSLLTFAVSNLRGAVLMEKGVISADLNKPDSDS